MSPLEAEEVAAAAAVEEEALLAWYAEGAEAAAEE